MSRALLLARTGPNALLAAQENSFPVSGHKPSTKGFA
jgi:hypothetical protein